MCHVHVIHNVKTQLFMHEIGGGGGVGGSSNCLYCRMSCVLSNSKYYFNLKKKKLLLSHYYINIENYISDYNYYKKLDTHESQLGNLNDFLKDTLNKIE